MSEIKVGDLVMIVSECCSSESHLGEVYTVEQLDPFGTICDHCGESDRNICAILGLTEEGEGWGLPLSWLKKIDPLSDLEGQKDSSGLDERFYEALRKMAEGLRS